MDVNKEVSQTQEESSTTATEQETTVKEDVKNPESDVSREYEKEKSNLRNIREAIKKERERLESLKSQAPSETVYEPPVQAQAPEGDDAVRRFLQAEANSLLALKMQTDPTFRDRLDIVRKEMENNPGLNVEDADNRVKSRLFDEIVKQSSSNGEVNVETNKLTTDTIPEPVKQKTGDPIKDILQDPNVNPYMKEAMKRRFGV